ncbi:MFS transporter [Bacillus sp. sid0103]|uniref:MFS transporter n=1 Tax=Bacillus sp. sid0103 TaxID=2856337 RepID=UPI00210BDB99|nr:MFS transporter [Bacillus sp. sid0103]
MSTVTNNLKWLIYSLCFVVLLGTMNAVLFNVALEDIAKDLSISHSKVSWITVGYALVTAIGSMIYGKLADRFRVKKLFIISIILFILGSIIGFSNQSFVVVIFARLLQASGGSAFVALAMVTVARLFTPDEKPRALAMISSSIALAVGMGSLVGGAINDTLGWPYLFLIMVISIVGITLLMKFMPKEETHYSNDVFHFDFLGALLLFGLIATFLLGVNINSWLFVFSFVLFFLFRTRMTKAKYPFIDIELFKNKVYLRLITVGFINNTAGLAIILLLPMLLVRKHGFLTFSVGICLFIGSLFGILSSYITGKTIPKFGNVKMIYISSTVGLVGYLSLGIFSNSNLVVILIGLSLTIMSYSSTQVSLYTLIPNTLKPEKIGVGLGLYNLTNFVGMAFGPAMASKTMEITNSFLLSFVVIAILISLHFILMLNMSSLQKRQYQTN